MEFKAPFCLAVNCQIPPLTCEFWTNPFALKSASIEFLVNLTLDSRIITTVRRRACDSCGDCAQTKCNRSLHCFTIFMFAILSIKVTESRFIETNLIGYFVLE